MSDEKLNVVMLEEHGLYGRMQYWENGNIMEEAWFKDKDRSILHRLDAPALIYYHNIGGKMREVWYKDGMIYRDDGLPADTYYFSQQPFNKSGEIWYLNGEIGREHGLASEIFYYKNGNVYAKKWYVNGIQHRTPEAAEIWYARNGNITRLEWIENGLLHRENGPAIIEYDENSRPKLEEYYTHGILSNKNELKLSYKNIRTLLEKSTRSVPTLKDQYQFITGLDEYSLTFLRDYTDQYYQTDKRRKQIDKIIQNLFLQIPPLKKPLVVYRGVTQFPFDQQRNFISTSLNRKIAETFMNGDVDEENVGCCMLIITVQKGSRVIPLEEISMHPREEEVLLSGNGIFTIVKEEVVNGEKTYYLNYNSQENNFLENIKIITFNLGYNIQKLVEQGSEKAFVQLCKVSI